MHPRLAGNGARGARAGSRKLSAPTRRAPDRGRVAVIGAGIAGLICARTLAQSGFAVSVFDKGRRPGGRVATRRTPSFSFDHGAQYLTARGNACRAWLDACRNTGAAAAWTGRIAAVSDAGLTAVDDATSRWVGVPGMRSLAELLAGGLNLHSAVEITAVVRRDPVWQLMTAENRIVSEADAVIVAVPAPQAVPLLEASPGLARQAAHATLRPCWALLLGFDAPLPVDFDAAFVNQGPLAWVSRNGSKPGRDGGEAWVLHASPEWSQAHLEFDADPVATELSNAFRAIVGDAAARPAMATAHRWRYAMVDVPVGSPCLFDADQRIGACGDWCPGGSIEAAFDSGRAMADRLIAALPPAGH